MIKALAILFLLILPMPVSALELEAPPVPDSGKILMPDDTDSFPAAISGILEKAIAYIRPDLAESVNICASLICITIIVSILCVLSEEKKRVIELAGSAMAAIILLDTSNAMITLAVDTVRQLSEYAKLLFPVLTAALAANGGVSTSSALYVGTAFFDSLLSSLLSSILIPAINLYLAFSVGSAATGDKTLKRIRDLIKSSAIWCLKVLMTTFTAYMSITGVITGTTDAAALKATKVAVSTAVPIVGGILSDASEAVLVSASVMKNSAGIYGIIVFIAIFLIPFLHIGVHYVLLKLTYTICAVFDREGITTLTEDCTSALGFLLGITGSVCLLLLISTICFMKGVM